MWVPLIGFHVPTYFTQYRWLLSWRIRGLHDGGASVVCHGRAPKSNRRGQSPSIDSKNALNRPISCFPASGSGLRKTLRIRVLASLARD
jgi:hypothetical protein